MIVFLPHVLSDGPIQQDEQVDFLDDTCINQM